MTPLTFDVGMVGARVLWRHWIRDRGDGRKEGCIQEFSPTGAHVRITDAPLPTAGGDWIDVDAVRILEVLELCYVQRMERAAAAAAKRARERRKKQREEGAESESE